MIVLTAAQSREADRRGIEDHGIPASLLMENAGRGAFEILKKYRPRLPEESVLVVAGKGNNGGDARIVAGLLQGVARQVQVFSSIGDETQFNKLLGEADVIVDGLFGTGLDRMVSGEAKSVIEAINGAGKWVLSLDIPSGLSADTGRPLGVAVRANVTATMGRPKLGLVLPEAATCVGILEVIEIGIGQAVYKEVGAKTHWVTLEEIRPLFRPREMDAHKGACGHLLLVGGSESKPGAILLSGRAALRSGAGLATVALPDKAFRKFPKNFLELMYEPMPSNRQGTFRRAGLKKISKLMDGKEAIAVGPGMGVNTETRGIVSALIRKTKAPLVLDADALNCIAPLPPLLFGERVRVRGSDIVLTPHPGEMARLLGTTTAVVQKDRIGVARKFAETHRVVVVLKGFRTVVATPTGEVFVNSTGNSGMATAGMGDVLTGIIGSLLAQGMMIGDAAVAGVWLHGRAGDRVADRLGDRGLLAGDLIDEIPLAIKELLH